MAPRQTAQISPLAQAVPSASDNMPLIRTRSRARLLTNVDDDEGESFRLDDVSGSDDPGSNSPDREESDVPVRHSGHTQVPTESKRAAADINHFFDRDITTGKATCKECKEAHDKNPYTWPSDINYVYSVNTSTTSLRPHISKYHLDSYMLLAKARGWNTSLVLKGQSQTSDSVARAQDDEPVEEFSEDRFQQLLVDFITADDQSIRVVENPRVSQASTPLAERY
ncbi:hypothetical protein EDB83DRAFT_2535834 [Lactarius deliciosus]|nr:hypothetical protein EDB83DRAFT_2535834 [Lactarius deliciosus]